MSPQLLSFTTGEQHIKWKRLQCAMLLLLTGAKVVLPGMRILKPLLAINKWRDNLQYLARRLGSSWLTKTIRGQLNQTKSKTNWIQIIQTRWEAWSPRSDCPNCLKICSFGVGWTKYINRPTKIRSPIAADDGNEIIVCCFFFTGRSSELGKPQCFRSPMVSEEQSQSAFRIWPPLAAHAIDQLH